MRSIRSMCIFLLLTLVMLAIPGASSAQIAVSITVGPPALPVYVQPICPGDGYIWTPGYWAPTVGFYGGINYGLQHHGE